MRTMVFQEQLHRVLRVIVGFVSAVRLVSRLAIRGWLFHLATANSEQRTADYTAVNGITVAPAYGICSRNFRMSQA